MEVPKRTFLGLGSQKAELHHPSESERDGGEGFAGNAAYRALEEPSGCPRVLALTLLATRSSCHASSFSAQQPYPSPRGSPPAAPTPPARMGRTGSGGGSRGLYLACRVRTVGAEARRGRGSWSLSWMEGTSQQTQPPRGRPSPDDTAARPPPGRPSRARALRPQYRDARLERPMFPIPPNLVSLSPEYLQGSGLCLFLHILRFSSSSRPGATGTVSIFPSFQSLTASPFFPTLGDQ